MFCAPGGKVLDPTVVANLKRDMPPLSRICVYACVCAYKFFLLFLIFSVEGGTTLLTPKKSPFSQELKIWSNLPNFYNLMNRGK